MICSGASFKIFAANADCPGSQHDARVYRESELYRRLAVDKFKPVPHGVILADKAYPVSFLIHFMLELNFCYSLFKELSFIIVCATHLAVNVLSDLHHI